MSVVAYGCRPEVGEASGRSTQNLDASRHRRRADGPQLERTHSLVISLAAFAAAYAGGPTPSAKALRADPGPGDPAGGSL
jgi:hypothetical protein